MNTEISLSDLFDLYMDTLRRCTSDNLEKTQQELEYDLFEEFDTGATSFLHDNSLIRLQEKGLINEKIRNASKQVRAKWLELNEGSWTYREIQSSQEWTTLFKMCDEILKELSTKA